MVLYNFPLLKGYINEQLKNERVKEGNYVVSDDIVWISAMHVEGHFHDSQVIEQHVRKKKEARVK